MRIEANAQTYFDNDSKWRFRGSVENWGCCNADDYMYFIDGDTLLNSQSYNLLKRKGYLQRWSCLNQEICPDTSGHYEVENSLLRQDGKKIYEIPLGDSVEYVLYDFDLQLGDSVSIFDYTYYVGQVTAIDSILVNGDYNKRFVVDDGMYINVLMEGIGFEDFQSTMIHESDLFYQNEYWVLRTELICYTENGTPYYTKQGEECSFNLGIEELNPEFNYIYDLENQFLEVQFPQGSRVQVVSIYDALAQEVICSESENSEVISFDLHSLETGVYFVVVRWDNNQQSFKILIP